MTLVYITRISQSWTRLTFHHHVRPLQTADWTARRLAIVVASVDVLIVQMLEKAIQAFTSIVWGTSVTLDWRFNADDHYQPTTKLDIYLRYLINNTWIIRRRSMFEIIFQPFQVWIWLSRYETGFLSPRYRFECFQCQRASREQLASELCHQMYRMSLVYLPTIANWLYQCHFAFNQQQIFYEEGFILLNLLHWNSTKSFVSGNLGIDTLHMSKRSILPIHWEECLHDWSWQDAIN